MKTWNEVKNILQSSGTHAQGCTNEDIAALSAYYKLELPMTYQSFLLYAGKGAGNFMMGSDAFYNSLFLLKEWADTFIRAHHLEPLPENAFVFLRHQGYMLAYFICDWNDNPPVYMLQETDQGNIERYDYASLADFLYEQLHDITGAL